MAFSPRQLPALAVIVAGLPFVWVALKLRGLSKTQTWLERSGRGAARQSVTVAEIANLARLIAAAANHTFLPSTCLTRSLLLHSMLLRRGVASHLRIGVRKENQILKAHAWVEVAGVPVNDEADIGQRFAPFDAIRPGRAAPRYD
jgi:hypothetical protein